MAVIELSKRVAGVPGLHALVIGINSYPHGATVGMLPLTSPVISAKAVATWLIKTRKSSIPLLTMEVLLSGASFSHKGVTSGGAKASQIEAALHGFYGRIVEGDHILVYLSGHGATDANANSGVFFCSDVGQNTLQPYVNSIKILSIVEGLAESGAAAQLFLFDTCRVNGGNSAAYARSPFAAPTFAPVAQQATIFAGPVNSKAVANVNEPSEFVKAFLASAASYGGKLMKNSWSVRPAGLVEGMNNYLKVNSSGAPQVAPSGFCEDFCVHEFPEPPDVILQVSIDSAQVGQSLRYQYYSNGNVLPGTSTVPPGDVAGVWSLKLKAGFYMFTAVDREGGDLGTFNASVDPLTETVVINCPA